MQRRVHTARARGVSFGATPEPPGAPEPRPPSAPEPRPPSAPGRALCSLRREPKLPPDGYTRGPLFSRASWVRTLAIAAAIPAGWRCLCRILGSASFVAVVRRLGGPIAVCPHGWARLGAVDASRERVAAGSGWHATRARRLACGTRGRRSDAGPWKDAVCFASRVRIFSWSCAAGEATHAGMAQPAMRRRHGQCSAEATRRRECAIRVRYRVASRVRVCLWSGDAE